MFLMNGLFSFIKGLTANEKKYFCQFVEFTNSENKIYYELFKEINQMETLDENYLKTKFATRYGGNLGMLKEKLFDQILNALHNFYREDNADRRIIKWTQDAKLLIHKGLYRLALKKIEKAIAHSFSYDRYLLIMHLLGLKKTILIHTQFESTSKYDIQELLRIEKKSLELLNAIRDANNDQLAYYYYLSKNENVFASKIAAGVQIKLQKKFPRSAKTIYLNITAHEYEAKGNIAAATKMIYKFIELLSFDKNYLNEYYGNYLLQSFNLIYLLLYQNRIAQASQRLFAIKKETEQKNIYKHLILSLYYSNIFILHSLNKDLKLLDNDIHNMKLDYNRIKRDVPSNLKRHAIYCRGYLLLANKEYKKCVQYLLINHDLIDTINYEYYKYWLLLLCCYIHLKDGPGIQYALGLFKSYTKFGNENYIEDTFILHYYYHENPINIKPKIVLKSIKSKPSNKEFYFPLNLTKEFK